MEVLTLEDDERVAGEQNEQSFPAEKEEGMLKFRRSFTDFSGRRHSLVLVSVQ